ncbi:unnamed protein product, partial [Ectocarpus fasciculatus]
RPPPEGGGAEERRDCEGKRRCRQGRGQESTRGVRAFSFRPEGHRADVHSPLFAPDVLVRTQRGVEERARLGPHSLTQQEGGVLSALGGSVFPETAQYRRGEGTPRSETGVLTLAVNGVRKTAAECREGGEGEDCKAIFVLNHRVAHHYRAHAQGPLFSLAPLLALSLSLLASRFW